MAPAGTVTEWREGSQTWGVLSDDQQTVELEEPELQAADSRYRHGTWLSSSFLVAEFEAEMAMRGSSCMATGTHQSCKRPWGDTTHQIALSAGWHVLETPVWEGPQRGRLRVQYISPGGVRCRNLQEVVLVVKAAHGPRRPMHGVYHLEAPTVFTQSGKAVAASCGRKTHKPDCKCHYRNLKLFSRSDTPTYDAMPMLSQGISKARKASNAKPRGELARLVTNMVEAQEIAVDDETLAMQLQQEFDGHRRPDPP